jgi:hypothetical protein
LLSIVVDSYPQIPGNYRTPSGTPLALGKPVPGESDFRFFLEFVKSERVMSMETGLIFRAKEHRGCGIRAASYRVGPQTWIPEACVSLQTGDGPTRLWVRSFAHCFMSENVTFSNKIEADNWAFNAAQTIIDKALPEFEPPTSRRVPLHTSCVSRFFAIASRHFSPFRCIHKFIRAK